MQPRPIELRTLKPGKAPSKEIPRDDFEDEDKKQKDLPEAEQCKKLLKVLQKAQKYVPDIKLPNEISKYNDLIEVLTGILTIGAEKFKLELARINANRKPPLTDKDEIEFLASFKDIKKSVFFRLFFIARALNEPFKINPDDTRNFEIIRARIFGEFSRAIDNIVKANGILEEICAKALPFIAQKIQSIVEELSDKTSGKFGFSIKQAAINIKNVAENGESAIDTIDVIKAKVSAFLDRPDVIKDAAKQRDYVILFARLRAGLNATGRDEHEKNDVFNNLEKEFEKPKPKLHLLKKK